MVGIGFIAIASLAWGILLSVYLARMWNHLVLAQRESSVSNAHQATDLGLGIIILSIIGANGFTALLLYLM